MTATPLITNNLAPFYGIVEGFFSRPLKPWNHAERLTTLEFVKNHAPHFNSYFYCPKDDPYMCTKWSELYPEKELIELKEVVDYCKKNQIKFIFGLNPEITSEDLKRDSTSFITRAYSKLNQIKQLGVKTFCLLFDDIPFAYDVVAQTGENWGAAVANKQIDILVGLLAKKLCKVEDLWLCPSDYFFTKSSSYLEELNTKLPIQTPWFWTGHDIFVPTITQDSFNDMRSVVGEERPIIWWNNYPVNDCHHALHCFHLAPVNYLSPNILEDLQGVLINPMRECFLNFISYLSFNHQLDNPAKFNPLDAETKAYETLFKGHAENLMRIFKTFAAPNIVENRAGGYSLLIQNAQGVDEINQHMGRLKDDLKIARKLLDDDSNEGQPLLKSLELYLHRGDKVIAMWDELVIQSNWNHLFMELDLFPILLTTYYRSTFIVLQKRITLLKQLGLSRSEENIWSKRLTPLTLFIEKYQGVSKKEIPKEEGESFMKTAESLIKKEQRTFISAIQLKSTEDKLKWILRRFHLNTYTKET